jgi:hypothetical protein
MLQCDSVHFICPFQVLRRVPADSPKESAARYGNGRQPGIKQLLSANNETELPAQTCDVALFEMACHDICPGIDAGSCRR